MEDRGLSWIVPYKVHHHGYCVLSPFYTGPTRNDSNRLAYRAGMKKKSANLKHDLFATVRPPSDLPRSSRSCHFQEWPSRSQSRQFAPSALLYRSWAISIQGLDSFMYGVLSCMSRGTPRWPLQPSPRCSGAETLLPSSTLPICLILATTCCTCRPSLYATLRYLSDGGVFATSSHA